jgi:hypothetical protein
MDRKGVLFLVLLIYGSTNGARVLAQSTNLPAAWKAGESELNEAVKRVAARFPRCVSATGDDAATGADVVGRSRLFVAWTVVQGGGVCVFDAKGTVLYRRSGFIEGVLTKDENLDGLKEFVVLAQGRGTGVSNLERHIHFVSGQTLGTPNVYDQGGYNTNFDPVTNPKGGDDYLPEIMTYESQLEFRDKDKDGFRESATLRLVEWWGAEDELLSPKDVAPWVSAALKRRYGVAIGEKRSRITEEWTWSDSLNRYEQTKVSRHLQSK